METTDNQAPTQPDPMFDSAAFAAKAIAHCAATQCGLSYAYGNPNAIAALAGYALVAGALEAEAGHRNVNPEVLQALKDRLSGPAATMPSPTT